jgi:predicted DNA-binding protein
MKHRAHVFLTESLIAKLRDRSEQTGLTMSDLIRRAIEAFLKKEQK